MELGHILMVYSALGVANLIGPCGGVGEYPFIFFTLPLFLDFTRHLALKMSAETRMIAQQRNSFRFCRGIAADRTQ